MKAKEPTATDQQLEKNEKKPKNSPSTISSEKGKKENGWGDVSKYEYLSGDEVEAEAGGRMEEWKPESGDEGKSEGQWERGGKRFKAG